MLANHLAFGAVLQLHLALGAVLQLAGETNYIDFDGAGPNGAARVHASCANEAASIGWAHPTEFAVAAGADTFFEASVATESLRSNNVTIQLRSVAPTCVNAAANQPCAPDDPREKPLFWCVYTGPGGEATVGPLSPDTFLAEKHGLRLSVGVRLSCPHPPLDELLRLSADGGLGSVFSLELTARYGVPADVNIPHRGPGSNSLRYSLPPPGPPSSPPIPSNPPPPPMEPPVAGCISSTKLSASIDNSENSRSTVNGAGSSYQPTNTIDGSTSGGFYLSQNGALTDQWLVYDLGSNSIITSVRIGNGQNPFGARNVRLESGDTQTGAFTPKFSLQMDGTIDYELQTFNIPEDSYPVGRWVRLFLIDNYGSTNYVKIMEVEFHGCSV